MVRFPLSSGNMWAPLRLKEPCPVGSLSTYLTRILFCFSKACRLGRTPECLGTVKAAGGQGGIFLGT